MSPQDSQVDDSSGSAKRDVIGAQLCPAVRTVMVGYSSQKYIKFHTEVDFIYCIYANYRIISAAPSMIMIHMIVMVTILTR